MSERNKIAGERKETETLAICESGNEPNHCPQSPGTCRTASPCNGCPALHPQTTGLRNHTQKHSSHQGQMHPFSHKQGLKHNICRGVIAQLQRLSATVCCCRVLHKTFKCLQTLHVWHNVSTKMTCRSLLPHWKLTQHYRMHLLCK